MRKIKKHIAILLALIIGLNILIFFSLIIGRYAITLEELQAILWSFFGGSQNEAIEKARTVFVQIRLPRVLLACIIGCGLSTAGAAYQGIFQNAMAAPDVLGASSGAAFGATLAILNGQSGFGITISAFAFSIGSVCLVYFISTKASGGKILGLVLSGIMISSLFSAGTSFMKLIADPSNQLPTITYWLMGSIAGARLKDISFVLLPMFLGLFPLILLRWRMNVLAVGDDEAKAMGVNVQAVRLGVIVAATLITAASVSVSGIIGWVGLVIPHLARRIVGNNYVHLIPMSMVLGAGFMLIVDNVSRNLFSTEIPLGILTAVIGAPFFLYLITRKGDSL